MPSLSIVTSSKWVSSVTDGSFGPVSQMDLGLQHLHIQIIRHFIRNLLFKSNNVLFCGTMVRAGTHGFLLLLKHGFHTWHVKRFMLLFAQVAIISLPDVPGTLRNRAPFKDVATSASWTSPRYSRSLRIRSSRWAASCSHERYTTFPSGHHPARHRAPFA